MLTSKRLNTSIDLVRGMAERTDTDLTDPRRASQFRSVVLRCAACEEQEACTKLQAAEKWLPETPNYCRNAQFFD